MRERDEPPPAPDPAPPEEPQESVHAQDVQPVAEENLNDKRDPDAEPEPERSK